MTQSVYCKCGTGFEVKEAHLGKWGRCPECAQKVAIQPGPPPPPKTPPQEPSSSNAQPQWAISDWAFSSLIVALPFLCIASSVSILLAFHPQPAVTVTESFEDTQIPDDTESVVAEPALLPAEFDANDFESTVRWIALLCRRVEEARLSQNEDLHVNEWNAVNQEFARVSGTHVEWQIPVGRLRQGFLSFAQPTPPIEPFGQCRVFISTFGQQFEWPPAALRKRPFPGNSVERNRLPLRGEAQISLGPGEVPGLQTTFVGDTLSLRAGKPVHVSGKASVSLSVADWEADIVISEATIDTNTKPSPKASEPENANEIVRELDQSQEELLRELQEGFDRTRGR